MFDTIPPNTPTGVISGTILPAKSKAIVMAVKRDSFHDDYKVIGWMSQINPTNGKYEIKNLPAGIYDLVIVCENTYYYSVFTPGVSIPKSFRRGSNKRDRSALQLLLRQLSNAYTTAYKIGDVSKFTSVFSPDYLDRHGRSRKDIVDSVKSEIAAKPNFFSRLEQNRVT